jgi:beta-phosphoglucomutase-like phosphatase (HAD superfamily)
MSHRALRYRCIIIDHDDTAVDSTATIHYPAHVEVLRQLRPGQKPVSLEGWFLKNFHPGIIEYLTDELLFNEEELQVEYEVWRTFTTNRVPHFYPGFMEALIEYRKRGGLIAVVSHSEKSLIERDYAHAGGNGVFMPDIVFGWDYDKSKRKPSLYPIREIVKAFSLEPGDMLIVDDLKPGVLMGKAARIAVAAAGWAHSIGQIREFMRENCTAYFEKVGEFAEFIMQ